jgi:predicted acylesterase/phospholipase RssA/CRP-like cAMP-binding protein
MEPVPPTPVGSQVERQALLAARPVCSGLDPQTLKDLEGAFESVRIAGGAQIVQRGQCGAPMVFVARGGLRASYVDGDGRRHVVFEYFQGATVGEALVLSGRPAPLDVHAIRDSHLLCLSQEKFAALGAVHPDLVLRFAHVVASRLIDVFNSQEILSSFAQMTDRVPHSVAVLVAGGEDVRRMRDRLAEALADSRTATRLTTEDARRALTLAREREEDVPYDRFVEWLGAREGGSDLLILECERSHPRWQDFCLRQADRIVVLAGEKELGPDAKVPDWWHDAKLGERSCDLELAIVHGRSDALPRGGAFRARLPGVSRLHHVRSAYPQDAAKLARWMLDRPVGLVLGGGGALGIAHVGVFKALEEARIPVDIVGGTSMGAIFAGGIARGWSADEMMDRVRRIFASPFALYDPTIPFASLLAGKKLDRVLRDLFEDIDIADLWTPFFCVSTNISRAYSEVHDSGSLEGAIRSSCSIPGLFPPHLLLEQVLVDGGLIDNLPIDVMGELCRGPIIAVDVFPYQRRKGHTGDRPRGRLAGLLEKLKPLAHGGVWLFDTLVHATLAGSQRTTAMSLGRHPPALYLAPELAKFRVLDWRAHEALFEAGRACARREIEAGALPRRLWEGPLERSAS